MPLVRIDLVAGKPESYRKAIGEAIYNVMRETINVPEGDRFQIVTEHPAADFIVDPAYLGITRTADCVIVQVTLNAGRTTDAKKRFYAMLAEELEGRIGLKRSDLFINLVEVQKENWSFGNGIGQYAT